MKRRLVISLIALFAVILFGMIGFSIFEPGVDDPFEAFYFTLVTITTVGYGDIVPTTTASRVIASVVMIGGIGAGLSTLQSVFDVVVSRRLRTELGLPERRTRMKDHYIICGYGNVGRQIVDQLREKGDKFVVIEMDKEKVSSIVEAGIPVIEGDAAYEEVLSRASIGGAKALITSLEDASNIMVVITAKMLNPKLYIVSEVEDYRNTAKLKKAGADEIVHCHEMGARVMVSKARRIVLDPVCGVEVDPSVSKLVHEFEGEKYYFCSEECLDAFKKNPKRFVDMKRALEATCGVV
ncbi:MAG: YHS domain-containing protein [Euryarchaeota archaeon]|nr:YHS domain-containing protein [Euryarchaeota archaeon]